MAYTRDEPTDVDVGVSRPILAANTNQADDSFGTDHVKFSVTTNNGYHHYIHLDAAYDGSVGITAPTGDITNIFATNTLATSPKPLPIFRNATGVGFLAPVGAVIRFDSSAAVSGMQINATVGVAAGVYTITFGKAMADANYLVIVSAEGASGDAYTQQAVHTKTTASFKIGFPTGATYLSLVVYGLISSLT